MSNKISKKVILSGLMAALCSGVGVNAMETGNVRENKFQNNVLNGSVNRSKADNAKKGFSGLSMVGTNAFSLTGGFLGGYLAAGKLNAPKNPPLGPTQEQYDKVVAERDKLKKEVDTLKNSNPNAEKIQELETKNQQLTSDLYKAKPYMDAANTIFDEYNVTENKRVITLENSLRAALAVWKRNDTVCDGNFKKMSDAFTKIENGGGQPYISYVRFILGKPVDNDQIYWQAVRVGDFKNFDTGVLKGAGALAMQLEEIVKSQHQIMKKLFDNLDQE